MYLPGSRAECPLLHALDGGIVSHSPGDTDAAKVDKSLCMGCGLCYGICPEVFEADGDQAIAKVDKVPAEGGGRLPGCRHRCPTEAIKIEEDEDC